MKKILFILLSVLIMSCSENSASSDPSYSCSIDHIGVWTLTDNGEFENSDCTGEKVTGTIYESSITLLEDCSYSNENSFMCSDPTSEGYEDLCAGNWHSSGNSITIVSFIPAVYILNDENTSMENQIQGQSGPSPEEMTPFCQYSVYSKQ